MRARGMVWLLAAATAACDGSIFDPVDPDVPTDLTYQLMPSGDPDAPLGVLLQWNPPTSGRANSYDVYARSSTREDFALRATTTSPSFHDAGIPQLQYYVQALDENDQPMGQSDVVEIDERNRLPGPQALTSVTLDRGVGLTWSSNAYDAAPTQFDLYRVYSTTASAGQCQEDEWALEGTTISEEFIVRNLANGVTYCFAISAISRDGHESVWSPLRQDTPRLEAKNVVVYANDVQKASSGFMFASGSSTGVVMSDTDVRADLVVERRADGLWARATRADVRLVRYGSSAVSELTTIDRAPTTGYSDAVKLEAGYGYVVRLQYADGLHFAAIRTVVVSNDFALFDCAFQPQVGSGELARATP